MTRSAKDREVSERARSLIDSQLGERGRFAMLEEMSGINTGQWKNFYYGRQLINDQMLAFLTKKYPHDAIWVLTGQQAPSQGAFPFLAPVPSTNDCTSVGQRLNWVIREWASPKGEALFKYLAEKSDQKIPPDDWAKVVLGLASPTLDMVCVVCWERPHFTAWVITGSAGPLQVNPTSAASVAAWAAQKEAEWKELEKGFTKTRPVSSKAEVTPKAHPIKKSPSTQKKHGNKKG